MSDKSIRIKSKVPFLRSDSNHENPKTVAKFITQDMSRSPSFIKNRIDNKSFPPDLLILELALDSIFNSGATTLKDVFQSLIWKGVLYRIKKMGINNEEIDKYLRSHPKTKNMFKGSDFEGLSYLKLDHVPKSSDLPFLEGIEQNTYEEISNFNPDILLTMPYSQQISTIQSWINYNQGSVEYLHDSYNDIYCYCSDFLNEIKGK